MKYWGLGLQCIFIEEHNSTHKGTNLPFFPHIQNDSQYRSATCLHVSAVKTLATEVNVGLSRKSMYLKIAALYGMDGKQVGSSTNIDGLRGPLSGFLISDMKTLTPRTGKGCNSLHICQTNKSVHLQ